MELAAKLNRLCREAQAGDGRAMEAILKHERQAIRQVARKYARSREAFEDLQQDGVLGVYEAVARFRPEVPGAGFAAYAYAWIRKFIREACLDRSSLVRVPSTYYRKKKPDERLRAAEVAADRVKSAQVFQVTPRDRVQEKEDDGHSAALAAAAKMATLPPIQRFVLGKRYGFDGAMEPATYSAIAAEVGCRPGAIKDIEKTAVAKLKALLAADSACEGRPCRTCGDRKSCPGNG